MKEGESEGVLEFKKERREVRGGKERRELRGGKERREIRGGGR